MLAGLFIGRDSSPISHFLPTSLHHTFLLTNTYCENAHLRNHPSWSDSVLVRDWEILHHHMGDHRRQCNKALIFWWCDGWLLVTLKAPYEWMQNVITRQPTQSADRWVYLVFESLTNMATIRFRKWAKLAGKWKIFPTQLPFSPRKIGSRFFSGKNPFGDFWNEHFWLPLSTDLEDSCPCHFFPVVG